MLYSNRWVAVRLDLVVSLIVASAGVLCVVSGSSFQPSYAALALTYCLQMGQLFQFATRQFSEAESTFTAVERINAPVPQESELWRAPASLPNTDTDDSAASPAGDGKLTEGRNQHGSLEVTEVAVSPNWPSTGTVEFVNVSVRYRSGLPLVLSNITLTIPAGTRLGLCRLCF
jgi:ATP-binding cassette, subfamily C (CFTR/MRP), member 1